MNAYMQYSKIKIIKKPLKHDSFQGLFHFNWILICFDDIGAKLIMQGLPGKARSLPLSASRFSLKMVLPRNHKYNKKLVKSNIFNKNVV
jgi:hypothetical protein